MFVVRVGYLLILQVLNYYGLGSNKKSRKGIPMNLSGPKLRERARKAADTRKRNRDKRDEITGESKKIVLHLDESLLNDFKKSMKPGHDLTLSAGIRHAMQDYIHKHRS